MATRGVNKVILIGNLGQDPELRYMPNGNAVTNISLATSEFWRDKQTGETKEQTEWHRVILFGKLAEIASEYLHKGAQVYIEGQLRTRKWTDQSGQDKYITEIIVNINGSMQMLGRPGGNQNNANWEQPETQQQNSKSLVSNTQSNAQKKSSLDLSNKSNIEFDDDIPF